MLRNREHMGEARSRYGLTRRDFLTGTVLCGTACMWSLGLPVFAAGDLVDYALLLKFLRDPDREAPLYVFNDFMDQFDEESHKANLDYFQNNQQLLESIQKRLGSDNLQWELEDFSYRIVFVPMKREQFVRLHQSYCRDAIQHVLLETSLENPLNAMTVLRDERPQIPDSGVTAYLVHNLAKEYRATYRFSGGEERSVSVGLNGKMFTRVVGAYSTAISIGANGRFVFENDRYTIWQTSARNPYTALSVPVEETLHIAVRDHTVRWMERELARRRVKTMGGLKRLVDDAMAVEEALVGGVVHALLPEFLKERMGDWPDKLLQEDADQKKEQTRYRYLRRGVAAVNKMGSRDAVALYIHHPAAFRRLLLRLPLGGL